MIAHFQSPAARKAKQRSQQQSSQPAPPAFELLLPAIRSQARVAFRGVPASEREELVAEVIANCYVAYARLVERGLSHVIYSTPLAQFAIRQVRSGRRVATKLNKHDVTSEYCQRSRRVDIERLDRRDCRGVWQEALVEDKTAGPADIAASRIDFAAWLRSLGAGRRRIAKTLASGETTSGAARKHRVSPARISQLRRELMEAWRGFQGELRCV